MFKEKLNVIIKAWQCLVKKISDILLDTRSGFHLNKISPVIKGKNMLKHADTAVIYSWMIDLNYESVESNQMFFLLKKSGCSLLQTDFSRLKFAAILEFSIHTNIYLNNLTTLNTTQRQSYFIQFVVFEVFFCASTH